LQNGHEGQTGWEPMISARYRYHVGAAFAAVFAVASALVSHAARQPG